MWGIHHRTELTGGIAFMGEKLIGLRRPNPVDDVFKVGMA